MSFPSSAPVTPFVSPCLSLHQAQSLPSSAPVINPCHSLHQPQSLPSSAPVSPFISPCHYLHQPLSLMSSAKKNLRNLWFNMLTLFYLSDPPPHPDMAVIFLLPILPSACGFLFVFVVVLFRGHCKRTAIIIIIRPCFNASAPVPLSHVMAQQPSSLWHTEE